jgi:hypothetical protein
MLCAAEIEEVEAAIEDEVLEAEVPGPEVDSTAWVEGQ